MSPILGIMASQGAIARGASFESIATSTVGSGGSSGITFSGIPTTYAHLQLRVSVKGTDVTDNRVAFCMQFNGITSSSYNTHNVVGEPSGTPSGGSSGTNTFMFGSPNSEFPGSGSGVNDSRIFGAAIIDIFDYKKTTKNKTATFLGGWDNNSTSTGRLTFESGLFRSTTAISSIYIFPNLGNWKEHTKMALYGIKEF